MSYRLALLFFASLIAACSAREETPAHGGPRERITAPSPPTPESVARGRALVDRFECNRCHVIPDVPPPAADQQCVGCHASIEAGELAATEEDLARWAEHITGLVASPDLAAMGARFDRGWIASFLLHPHDLRPELEATMPRLDLDEREAQDIAAFLTRDVGRETAPPPPDDPALVARGRRLFAERACSACHSFPDRRAPERARLPASNDDSTLAPDLRVTRARFRPDRLVAWIQHPRAFVPDTPMPDSSLSDGEARALASYVLYAELLPEETREPPPMLSLLERRVTYEEVAARVFSDTCRHCHADPDLAMGDGGPGNHGGFGFAPAGLNLTNYEGAAAGALVDGRRMSIYAVDESGMPRLIRALRARQLEEAGRVDEGMRGMPLGLPALSPEEIQLVASWIAQGRPR